MMNTSFYNGVSGIKSQQFGLDVWSNNISNISTTGFRGSTPEFSSLFATTLSDGGTEPTTNNIGMGAQSQTTGLNLTQGVLENTDNPFDLAIGGEGWFGVQSQAGQTYYTRAGQFSVDKNGDMVDLNGNYLLATSGNNITSTTLDTKTLDEFGKYYTPVTTKSVTPYAITSLNDIPLTSTGAQTKITLPDFLYFPPEPTKNVSYSANLKPTVNIDSTMVTLDALDYPSTVTATTSGTISLSGTISNTSEVLNPQTDDMVYVTLSDVNGQKLNAYASLDATNNWSIANYDVSSLDLSAPLQVSAAIKTTQEVANVEHFSTSIISPTGDKDILDMTFTKRVPQQASGSTWDAEVKVLSFYETYNPNTTYDPELFNVDETSKKVYNITDTQTGVLSFGTGGELLSNTIPTISNSGVPLTLNLGAPNSFDQMISSTGFSKGNSAKADGTQEGFLEEYGMDGSGNVVASFSNGKSSAIAKVALYHFQNDQGLESVSSTLFSASSNSGKPIFYADKNGVGFLGSHIYNNKLEGSNVNIATALTELIVMQKAFDASSKSITTSDQMIQNAINMKK